MFQWSQKRNDLANLNQKLKANKQATVLYLRKGKRWYAPKAVNEQLNNLRGINQKLTDIEEELNQKLQEIIEEPERLDYGRGLLEVAGALLSIWSAIGTHTEKVQVKGYRRKNGTYVKPHYKTVRKRNTPIAFDVSNRDTTKEELSPKEILIEQYKASILEVERTKFKCQDLINTGLDYIDNPVKVRKRMGFQEQVGIFLTATIIIFSLFLILAILTWLF
jgi:hypothetical protein